MEEESLQEQKHWEGHHAAGLSDDGNVCSLVRCRDQACDTTRHQKAEDLSDEMPLRHPRIDSVGHALECGHPEGSRRATCGGATEAHETAMARPCGMDERPPPPEATPQVQATGK